MKVCCIKFLDQQGYETSSDAWLSIGRVYPVFSIFINANGARSYSLVTSEPEGEWPQMAGHSAECFEIVSTIVPSNWSVWLDESGAMGVSPTAWQTPEFSEGFYDHVPEMYPIFVRERDVILREDP